MTRRRSLRTNLFVAIVLVVVLSIGLMLVVGAVLTRRQVEHATLEGLAHQADVLNAREVFSILPLNHLRPLNKLVLAKQQEQAIAVNNLRKPSPYLPGDTLRRVRQGQDVNGTERINGTDYFFAARRIGEGPKALVLLRPRSRGNSAFYPFLVGLLIAAGAGIALAAAISSPTRKG